jgi:hypothetical protein
VGAGRYAVIRDNHNCGQNPNHDNNNKKFDDGKAIGLPTISMDDHGFQYKLLVAKHKWYAMAMNNTRPGFGIIEIVIGLVIIGLIVTVAIFLGHTWQKANPDIDSYAACAAAGNPVLQTYPEQCVANGKTFTNPNQKAIQKH